MNTFCGGTARDIHAFFLAYSSVVLADKGGKMGGKEREGEKVKGREGRGTQSGRACSADWYQWRQIELAGDR